QAGGAEIHMAAGECWIFDTWARHRVINNADSTRIHLVADTVGGDRLWELIARGRPHNRQIPGWRAEPVPLPGKGEVSLDFESVNLPVVMTPWEMRDHCVFLLNEVVPGPTLPAVQPGLPRLTRRGLYPCAGLVQQRHGSPH